MWPQFLQQQNVGEGHTVGASISPTPTTYHLPSPRPLPERKGTGSWSMGASLRLAGLGGFTDLPLPFNPTGQARLPSRRTGRAAEGPGDHSAKLRELCKRSPFSDVEAEAQRGAHSASGHTAQLGVRKRVWDRAWTEDSWHARPKGTGVRRSWKRRCWAPRTTHQAGLRDPARYRLAWPPRG